MLFTQARITAGDRLLVQGAGGGAASAAIKLAVAAGAVVYATSRSEAKRAEALAWGARAALDAEDDHECGVGIPGPPSCRGSGPRSARRWCRRCPLCAPPGHAGAQVSARAPPAPGGRRRGVGRSERRAEAASHDHGGQWNQAADLGAEAVEYVSLELSAPSREVGPGPGRSSASSLARADCAPPVARYGPPVVRRKGYGAQSDHFSEQFRVELRDLASKGAFAGPCSAPSVPVCGTEG